MGGRGERPLPGHLRPRRLQPRDHDPGWSPGAQRGPGQPAQLARAETAHRGRGRDPARQRGAPVLPARLRHPAGVGGTRAVFPGPRGPGDDPAEPSIREHGRQPPGRHRVDPHPAELVGSHGGGLRARRAGDQPDGRALPRARGPPPQPGLPPHLRSADDRAQGADPTIEHLHRRGRPDPGVPRRRPGRGGAQPPPDGGLHPAGPRLRRHRRGAGARREAGRTVHLSRQRDHRAVGGRGPPRAALPRLRRRRWPSTRGHGPSCGTSATCSCRANPACSCCCASTPPTCCRSAPATPPGTTRAFRPAGSTARPTAATCSGTSSTSTRSSTSGSRRSPAGCCSTATAGCPRHGRRRERRATGARCSRGRAAATAPRRPRSCTSTRCPGSGNPTTATTSATSTRRSSTTCGSTTRPPTTWDSSATTAPS